MMTRKDFEILAREYGWLFYQEGYVFDVPSGEVRYSPASREIQAVEMNAALRALKQACLSDNPNFRADLFMQTVNDYALMAREIGNGIFSDRFPGFATMDKRG